MGSQDVSIFSQMLHLSLSESQQKVATPLVTGDQSQKVNRLGRAIGENDACFGADNTTRQVALRSLYNVTHWTPQARQYNVSKQNLERLLNVCTRLQNQEVPVSLSLQEHHTVLHHEGTIQAHVTQVFRQALNDFSDAERKELEPIVTRIAEAISKIAINEEFPGMQDDEKSAVQKLPGLLQAVKLPSCNLDEIQSKCASTKEKVEQYCDREEIDYRMCPLAEDIALIEMMIVEKRARLTTASNRKSELPLPARMERFLQLIQDIRSTSEIHPDSACSDEVEKILEQHVDFLISSMSERERATVYLAQEKDLQKLISAFQQFIDTFQRLSVQVPHNQNFPKIDTYIKKKLQEAIQSESKKFMDAILASYKTKNFKAELETEIEAIVQKTPSNAFTQIRAGAFLSQSAQIASAAHPSTPELQQAVSMIGEVGASISPHAGTSNVSIHRLTSERDASGHIVSFRPANPQVYGTTPPRMNNVAQSILRVAVTTMVMAQFLLLEVLSSAISGSQHLGLEIVYALGFSMMMGLVAELTRGLPGGYNRLASVFVAALAVLYYIAKPQAIHTMRQVQVSFAPEPPDWMQGYQICPVPGAARSPGPSITREAFPRPRPSPDWMQRYQLSPVPGPDQSPGPSIVQSLLPSPVPSVPSAAAAQSPIPLPFSLPQSPLPHHVIEVAQKVEEVGFFARMSRLFTGG